MVHSCKPAVPRVPWGNGAEAGWGHATQGTGCSPCGQLGQAEGNLGSGPVTSGGHVRNSGLAPALQGKSGAQLPAW